MDYSLILLDILRGYSYIDTPDGKIYLKHISIEEQLSLTEFEKEDFDNLVKSGIKPESTLLSDAISYGGWSEEEEKQIKDLTWTVDKSEKASNNIADANQKQMFRNTFQKERSELKILKEKKQKIISFSAEVLSSTSRTKRYAELCFFRDPNFTKKIKKDIKQRYNEQLFKKIGVFFDEKSLINEAYEPSFFEPFILQNKSPFCIFGKSLVELSYLQSRLMVIANTLLSKFKNCTNIPEDVSSDAVALFKYEESDNKHNKGKTTEGVSDLKAKMNKKGKLTSEDLLS